MRPLLIVSNRLRDRIPEQDGIFLPDSDVLSTELSYHTDLRLCPVGHTIVCSPSVYPLLKESLPEENLRKGKKEAKGPYPDDVPYNAVQVGSYLFCNRRYTDPVLLEAAEEEGLIPVSVRQGYCRCNIAVVSGEKGNEALLTEDRGIEKAAAENGIRVLRISPGGVSLPGWSYGFIGGASVSRKGEILFFGEIRRHPESRKILTFCEKNGCSVKEWKGLPLTDFGGGVWQDFLF